MELYKQYEMGEQWVELEYIEYDVYMGSDGLELTMLQQPYFIIYDENGEIEEEGCAWVDMELTYPDYQWLFQKIVEEWYENAYNMELMMMAN